MVEVASVFQGCQIGLELTPGDPVPADKRLLALGLEPAFNPVTDGFRPMGTKYESLRTLDREWTAVNLTGKPTYSELIYPLASILTSQVVSAGSGAYTWSFSTDAEAPDTVQTYTVEYGNATTGARRFAGAVVRSLGLAFSRTNGISMRGEMIGTAIEEGITPTGSPALVPLVPVLPAQTSIYLDTDPGDLGTTKLHRVFSAAWNLNNKFNAVWPLDSDIDSFGATVELPPEHTLEMTMAYDAEGVDQVARLRASTTAFIRIEAVGAVIGGGNNFRLRLDFAGAISAIARPTDQDGVFSIPVTFTGIKDGDWGQVLAIELVNEQADL